MIPKWQKGIVRKIVQESPNTRRFFLELPETECFEFLAGQYITLDLPIHERRNLRWRSYSIASMPMSNNEIELLIVHAVNGAGTDYLFNEINEGSELTLRGPGGTFTLPANINDKDLFLICTGTGIAPFRSMLQYIHHHKLQHKNIHLVFGCRKQEDLLYVEELKALEKTMKGFHYHPTLSREDWGGHKGYVHTVYEDLCSDKQPAVFMLCGWSNMVDEALQKIEAMGYEQKDILHELYG
jgi:CDP-4-dehydro-6-deoxyglucose reductase